MVLTTARMGGDGTRATESRRGAGGPTRDVVGLTGRAAISELRGFGGDVDRRTQHWARSLFSVVLPRRASSRTSRRARDGPAAAPSWSRPVGEHLSSVMPGQ